MIPRGIFLVRRYGAAVFYSGAFAPLLLAAMLLYFALKEWL